jgi:hypothetical protein
MDLVSIIREARKGKWAVLPVVFLTLVGVAYVLVVRPPEYVSNSALTLIYPPAPPTSSQIASDPALRKVNANNPYEAYGDLTVVGAVVQQAMGGQGVVDQLRKEGVQDGYTITSDPTTTNPIIHIDGVGATPAAALRATTILSRQVETTLRELQAREHVIDHYQITVQVLNTPSAPTLKISSKLRSLIAVLVAGVIMMFIALSIRRGIVERKLAKPVAWTSPPEPAELAARRKSRRFVGHGSVGASERQNGNSTKTRGPNHSTRPASTSSSD